MKPWMLALLAGAYLVGYAEGYFVGEREGKDSSATTHDEELGDAYRAGVSRGEYLARHPVGVNGG